MQEIVILGAEGMLGRAFSEVLATLGRHTRKLGLAQCDLCSDEQIARAVRGAGLVINCAAYTNVDGAETDEATATRVNGTAVGVLSAACREQSVPLIHFSTDYVFDGLATAPYPVDHARAPISAYGRSKALGESHLEASDAQYLLVRTSWVYAPWGQNFVRTMAALLQSRPSVRVVTDQRGRPSEARALARNTLRLFDAGARGTFHVTDGGECSWFEFAQAIARVIGARAEVLPCATADFPRPAPRPAYSVLDLEKAEHILGSFVGYERQLERMADALRSG